MVTSLVTNWQVWLETSQTMTIISHTTKLTSCRFATTSITDMHSREAKNKTLLKHSKKEKHFLFFLMASMASSDFIKMILKSFALNLEKNLLIRIFTLPSGSVAKATDLILSIDLRIFKLNSLHSVMPLMFRNYQLFLAYVMKEQ